MEQSNATPGSPDMRTPPPIIWAAAALMLLASCGDKPPAATGGIPNTTAGAESATMSPQEQLVIIDKAVAEWRRADSIEAAHLAAETAANLVVGPNGPEYGDRNGDGVISGQSPAGLLPGLDGTPVGLAVPSAANDCVARDVLGGSWTDPAAEWEAMLSAIQGWRTDNNTMPSLASHPMRIVGWATFTLRSGSLEEAHEYAGHAQLHVDIAQRAFDC